MEKYELTLFFLNGTKAKEIFEARCSTEAMRLATETAKKVQVKHFNVSRIGPIA